VNWLTGWRAQTGLESAVLRQEIAEKLALLIQDGLDEMAIQQHDRWCALMPAPRWEKSALSGD
jgi:hypothetical protein